ncbi:MAG: STAS domain-containing protein [Bacillota bacterium]|nr:STAS domain-containing protein [Bacillota bacterium]MDP4170664.1 STAS domain-containing protein [Bacillota bacterium]
MEKTEIEKLKDEIEELRAKLNESELLIKDISVPIIPSVIPETILAPITGKLTPERFEMIIEKMVNTSYSDVATVIFDFTSISNNEIGEIEIFGQYIQNLTSTLNLMGVEAIYVGFTPIVTQKLINSGLQLVKELHTFLSFRQALQYLMKQKGLSFQKI